MLLHALLNRKEVLFQVQVCPGVYNCKVSPRHSGVYLSRASRLICCRAESHRYGLAMQKDRRRQPAARVSVKSTAECGCKLDHTMFDFDSKKKKPKKPERF